MSAGEDTNLTLSEPLNASRATTVLSKVRTQTDSPGERRSLQNLFRGGNCISQVSKRTFNDSQGLPHTIKTSIIRLNESLLDLTIFNNQSIPLTPLTPKDGSSLVKREIQRFSELERWISDEADLSSECQLCEYAVYLNFGKDLHRSCQMGQGSLPTRSFCNMYCQWLVPRQRRMVEGWGGDVGECIGLFSALLLAITYTKTSLTETTNTGPAFFNLGEEM